MKFYFIILLIFKGNLIAIGQSAYGRLTHQNLIIDPQYYPPKIMQVPLFRQQNASMGGYYCDSNQKLLSVYGFINNINTTQSIQEPYNYIGYCKDKGVNFYNSSICSFGDTIVSVVGLNWDKTPLIPNYNQSAVPILKGGEINFYTKNFNLIKTYKLREFTFKTTVFKFTKDCYNIIVADTIYLYSYRLTNKDFVLVDSIKKKVFNGGQLLDDGHYNNQLKFSSTGTKLGYLNFSIVSHYDVGLGRKVSYDSGFFDIIEFDPYSCRFLSEKEILRYQIYNYKARDIKDFVPISFEFSANDSILYITHCLDVFKDNKVYYDLIVRQYNLINPSNKFIDFYAVKGQEGAWYTYPYNLFLSPNGKIYLYRNKGTNSYDYFTDRNDTFSVIVDEISRPDILGKLCLFRKNVIQMNNIYTNSDSSHLNFYTWPSLNFYPITPIKFSISVRCSDSTILFRNQSKNVFKKFIWYFSQYDSTLSQHSEYKYIKPGKYFVKIRGYYNDNNFIESGDSIEVKPEYFSPKSKFSTYSKEGCQFILFNFKNESISAHNLNGFPKSQWYFGNGRDTTIDDIKNVSTVYTSSGLFNVSLIIDNGYCRDTFTLSEKINIKAAPKPGIIFTNAPPYCERDSVLFGRKFMDFMDSVVYYFDFKKVTNRKNSDINTIYPKKGIQSISQLIYGPTGCIVADSIKFIVNSGFSSGFIPVVNSASVIDNKNVKIKWTNYDSGFSNLLFRNGIMLIESKHINEYIDKAASPQQASYSYYCSNRNVCGELSDTSFHINSILLQGIAIRNEFSNLSWNSFKNELGHYQIIQFSPVTTIYYTDNLNFIDNDFAKPGYDMTCYIIKYLSTLNDSLSSFSNQVCLNYIPTLFIPTSFSPNNDGLNDTYKVETFGVKKFSLLIYNLWGEIIFETQDQNESWNGVYKDHLVPSGAYFVKIHASGLNTNINKGTVINLNY